MRRFGLQVLLVNVSVLLISMPAFSSGLFNSTVDQLPTEQRNLLRQGQPLITGEQGKYTARVLLNTSQDLAWDVLTDYSNIAKFMPNVVSSTVLSANGNQKVIEQVDARQVFLITVRSRIRSAITETAKSRIDFRQIEGDLKSMTGYWVVEPIAPFRGAKPNQVLITQVIEVTPQSGTPKEIFYSIFRSSLGENLSAIRREVTRRTK
jgi:ribosome-associated toxin RatA of RatAB toxin-antitoxin module